MLKIEIQSLSESVITVEEANLDLKLKPISCICALRSKMSQTWKYNNNKAPTILPKKISIG